jgi:hypothetical protein
MFESASLAKGGSVKHIAAYVAVIVLGGGLGGYAIHEHNAAQSLAADDAQATARLNATQQQLSDLNAKVNMLASRTEAPPAPAVPSAQTAVSSAPPAPTDSSTPPAPAVPSAQTAASSTQPAPAVSSKHTAAGRRPSAVHRRAEDPRYKKLQSQLDAQGKAIEQTRNELAGTQGDLTNTRTELTGSIARTHGELVVLQKTGERNYYEFDLGKAKEFKREGPISISLRKADAKHQNANLALLVDDRNISQKHVNLYQPSMFYQPDTQQPIEIVINEISKDHVHGYVSAPKYRRSELAAMSNAGANPAAGTQQAANQGDNGVVGSAPAPGADQANSSAQPVLKQRPSVPN